MHAWQLRERRPRPGFALDLRRLAHVSVHHDHLALAAEPFGDVLHRELGRLLIVRAHERGGSRLGLGIHVHDGDAGRQGLFHRRRTGLHFARIEDDRVHVLGDEAFNLLDLLLGASLGIVDNEADTKFSSPLFHRFVDHGDELGRKVHERYADHRPLLASARFGRRGRTVATDYRCGQKQKPASR